MPSTPALSTADPSAELNRTSDHDTVAPPECRLVRHSTQCEGGFSLVEVIVALGLLAGVLVSVAGMFVLGQRQVASGRNSSEALAVAQGLLEEMQGWGFHQTYALFQDGDCTPASDATCTIVTDTNAEATKWQDLLAEALDEGRAEIEFASLGGGPLADAAAIRIAIRVRWIEGDRPRTLSISTVRM